MSTGASIQPVALPYYFNSFDRSRDLSLQCTPHRKVWPVWIDNMNMLKIRPVVRSMPLELAESHAQSRNLSRPGSGLGFMVVLFAVLFFRVGKICEMYMFAKAPLAKTVTNRNLIVKVSPYNSFFFQTRQAWPVQHVFPLSDREDTSSAVYADRASTGFQDLATSIVDYNVDVAVCEDNESTVDKPCTVVVFIQVLRERRLMSTRLGKLTKSSRLPHSLKRTHRVRQMWVYGRTGVKVR